MSMREAAPDPAAAQAAIDEEYRQFVEKKYAADKGPMTSREFAAARQALGLTGEQVAAMLQTHLRTVRGWEQGMRNGAPAEVPHPVALLMRLAVKYPAVRRDIGIEQILRGAHVVARQKRLKGWTG